MSVTPSLVLEGYLRRDAPETAPETSLGRLEHQDSYALRHISCGLLFAEMFAPVLCPALLEVPEPLRKAKALAACDPVAIMQRMKRKGEQDEKAKIEFAIEIEKGHCRARNECFGSH